MDDISIAEQLKFELGQSNNWSIHYVDSDEIVHVHNQREHHYVRVARAIDRDHVWYGLLHVGELSPTDHRYTGADRKPFDSYAAAQAWATNYLDAHPDGIDPDDIQEDQLHYNWEDKEETPVEI